MISILIVDDDERKVERVQGVIAEGLDQDAYRVTRVATVADAGRCLRDTAFDLLILDLNVPVRAGEAPRADGGLTLMRYVTLHRDIHRPKHIVGLTAFPKLAAAQRAQFDNELWSIVRYDEATREWEELLARKLVYVSETLAPNGRYQTDVCIITALEEVELQAVLELPCEWTERTIQGDPTIYHESDFRRDERRLRVVAAAAGDMGMPTAAALAMKMITTFRPRYLAMAGIAAGVGHCSYGDVLVADQSWDYGSGKLRPARSRGSVLLPAPQPIPISAYLKARFALFKRSGPVFQRIREAWGGAVPPQLKMHLGPVASGAAVLEDRAVVDSILAHNRKLIGVEMETYGVFVAARLSGEPEPLVMSVKSVCDFADETKTDEYQRYAAYTSAHVLYEFALAQLLKN